MLFILEQWELCLKILHSSSGIFLSSEWQFYSLVWCIKWCPQTFFPENINMVLSDVEIQPRSYVYCRYGLSLYSPDKKIQKRKVIIYCTCNFLGGKGLICTIKGLCKVTNLICSSVYLILWNSLTIVYKGVLIRELIGCGLLYTYVNEGKYGLGWAMGDCMVWI